MHKNTIYKYGLLISVFAFLFFSFSSLASAVNYNTGLYNAGFYSSVAPGTTVATPVAGIYNTTKSVTLTSDGSTSIRYSLTETPADCSTSGILYSDSTPISVSTSQTIYVRACNIYGNYSTESFAYTIDTTSPETPTASQPAGPYNTTLSITLDAVGSNYIKYLTTGIPATCSDGTPYGGAITVSTSQTIYVKACDNAGNFSSTSFAYVIDTTEPLTPVASPIASIYNVAQSVTLTASGSDTIRYSTTGTPTNCSTSGTLYSVSTPISVATSQTIYVRACDNAGNFSNASFAYVIDTTSPETPIATPIAGEYKSTRSVTLTATGSNYIKYSTTGIPATCSAETSYEGAITVSTSQTIYVRACDNAGNFSNASFAYVIRGTRGTSGSTPYVISQPQIQQQGGSTIPSSNLLNIIRTLKQGMTGDDVKALQDYLNAHGYNCGTADGDFGPKTKAAVILFQKANGLTPDGIVGPKTREHMNQSQTPIVTPPAISRTLKLGMTGNDVRDLQTYLNGHGYDCGTADGDFGPKTKAQVILFQKAKGLIPDGVVGPKTRELMK